MQMKKPFEFAVNNVTHFGDTDVFPYPIENHIFYDKQDDVIKILKLIHKDFNESLSNMPPVHVKSLSVVGYTGFRSATQIDPIWNAYFLALVLTIGYDIERVRIPTDRDLVFSYRFKPNFEKYSIFDLEIGWRQYQEKSVMKAREYSFVLSCDISDFYPRIYHHRLENALKRATKNTECIRRIMELLSRFSDGASYGLPVGGPAARLLSELLLNRIDKLLVSENIPYCRFVDDYHIFASSREQAYEFLISLSEMLLVNEGLLLQKTKTRITSSEEFLATAPFAPENKPDTKEEIESKQFINIRLKFDPYSPTAEEDYEDLRQELKKFDVVGMLAREMRKSRIDEAVTRRLVNAIKYLDESVRSQAVVSLVENFTILYPVFPIVMIVIKSIINELDQDTRSTIFKTIRGLIQSKSYITKVPANLSFALRVLAYDDSEETDSIMASLYKEPLNMMIKRDIILIMARRNADYWISNCRNQYELLTPWERRALIIASYTLEDEGAHWREAIKKGLSEMDHVVMIWASRKKNSGSWDIPI